MKIVMIGQKGIPTIFGGIERHVEEISCRLAKKHKVFVYARSYYTPKQTRRYKHVNIIHSPSLKTKHLDAISHVFLSSLHAVFKVRPNVYHFHGIGPALLLWIPKLLAPRAKIVFTFHCRDYFHQKWGLLARFSLKTGEFIGCLFADEIIAVSKELQKYIKANYRKKSRFIAHGVSRPDEIKETKIIKQWGLAKDDYFLAVSRLIPHKGIQYLINAFKQVKTDKKLVIVGPSFYTEGYENQLKQMAAGDKRIVFLGAQRGQALTELFGNAYIFVHPSEQEGLPMTVMEAGSFGRPLLLSDISIHKEMFGQLPFFFKNKNVNDLKRKLELVLKNPRLLIKRAGQIKKYSVKKYDWDKAVEKTILKYT